MKALGVISSALGLILLSGGGGTAQAGGVLRAATEGTFRPFNYYDGDQLTGFEVELVNALAKKLHLKVSWTTEPFDSLLTDVAAHKFDLVAASHAITPARAKTVEFVNPHYCTGASIVTRKGGPTSLQALEGKTVGAAEATTYFDRLKGMTRFKEIKSFADGPAAMQALHDGAIDAWVTDRFVAVSLLKSAPGAGLDMGDVIFPEMIAMAVAKDNGALRDKLNSALSAMMHDGSYEKLSVRYFNSDLRCRSLSRRSHSEASGN